MKSFKNIVLGVILLIAIAIFGYFLKFKKVDEDTTTHYNKDYNLKMINSSKPTQETPWGFQEISLKSSIEHRVSSISEYQKLIKNNTKNYKWLDNKVHIIHFAKGVYRIPLSNTYYVLLVPSQTIIEGAGVGKTIFKAVAEISKKDKFHFRRLFNLEYATHDVVVRGISFYNKTKDNKWGLFHSNGSFNRENYLFENIEFDDIFGTIGKNGYSSNFITLRGLKKRIGNTTKRIKDNFKIPIPIGYQFYSGNQKNVKLAGQIGIREGNGVVIHDCILGDNISATLDIYSNYVEIVGVKFINPLHDHAIKAPKGNHLYIHDSSFELNYNMKLIEDSGYWNPTFITHEITNEDRISLRKCYHFKNLKFIRKYKKISALKDGVKIDYIESEPFTIYDESKKRHNNVSGDVVWENISFNGYSKEHQVVGYPNVQIKEGYEALNYTNFVAKPAQMKLNNKNLHGTYKINIQQRVGSSKEDKSGVYSWGANKNFDIDYPRDNRLFVGSKQKSRVKDYILLKKSTVKDSYLK